MAGIWDTVNVGKRISIAEAGTLSLLRLPRVHLDAPEVVLQLRVVDQQNDVYPSTARLAFSLARTGLDAA